MPGKNKCIIVYVRSSRKMGIGPCSLLEAEKYLARVGFRRAGKNLWCRKNGTSLVRVKKITSKKVSKNLIWIYACGTYVSRQALRRIIDVALECSHDRVVISKFAKPINQSTQEILLGSFYASYRFANKKAPRQGGMLFCSISFLRLQRR